jgi:hypothetical protein
MEHGGLRWVGIRLEEGGFVSAVVDPDASYVRKKITSGIRGISQKSQRVS